MLSLTRRSAAVSSLSQPAMRKSVRNRRKQMQELKLVIDVVSRAILPGRGGDVKGIVVCCSWRVVRWPKRGAASRTLRIGVAGLLAAFVKGHLFVQACDHLSNSGLGKSF